MNRSGIAAIRHLALDMDGTLYRGKTLFPETVPFLETLSELGIGYTFFTNNSSKSVRDYVTHLNGMGIAATADQFQTSTLAAIAYLKRNHEWAKRIFFVGTASMIAEFEEAGFSACDEAPDMVVVGFDPQLSFNQLCRGGYWISRGIPYIATHPDRVCPTDQPTLLVDCGSICAALEAATGRPPEAVLGKPHPIMVEEIMRRHNLRPDELGVVGDRVYTDLAMARGVGAYGVLVLTGETGREEGEAAMPAPDLIVDSVGELAGMLAASRTGAV